MNVKNIMMLKQCSSKFLKNRLLIPAAVKMMVSYFNVEPQSVYLQCRVIDFTGKSKLLHYMQKTVSVGEGKHPKQQHLFL